MTHPSTPEARAKAITPCPHGDCGLACRRCIANAIRAAVEQERQALIALVRQACARCSFCGLAFGDHHGGIKPGGCDMCAPLRKKMEQAK